MLPDGSGNGTKAITSTREQSARLPRSGRHAQLPAVFELRIHPRLQLRAHLRAERRSAFGSVALSAFGVAAERAASAGCDRHVVKPFDPEALVLLPREMLTSGGAMMPNQSNRRAIPDSDLPRA